MRAADPNERTLLLAMDFIHIKLSEEDRKKVLDKYYELAEKKPKHKSIKVALMSFNTNLYFDLDKYFNEKKSLFPSKIDTYPQSN